MEEDREEVTEVSQTEEMKKEEKIFTPLSEVSSGRAGASLALLLFADPRPAPPLAAANQEPALRRPCGAAAGGLGPPQVRPSHRAGERAHLLRRVETGLLKIAADFGV